MITPETAKKMLEALRAVKAQAKTMRTSRTLQGPREYQNNPAAMLVWERTRYHDGKALHEAIRAAIKQAEEELND